MKNRDKRKIGVPPSGARGLLVIRLSAMGDVAMTVPVLIALAQTYPDLKVTVLTKPFFAPILSQIPTITVHKADVKEKHKGIWGLWKLYKELRAMQIDGVADLHNVLRSTILKQFFRFQGVRFLQMDKDRKGKKALKAAKNKKFEPLKSMHLRYAEVFGALGFPVVLNESHVLPKHKLSLTLKKTIRLRDAKYIGIAPFAAFDGKMYPIHLMKKVVAELNALGTHQLLLFGGGMAERQQLETWEQEFEHCTSVVGKMNFADELGIISNLSVMLAMDSGNAHLAAMYGVPTITLWGVTHPYAGFAPFGQPESNALLADRQKYPLIPTSIYGNKFPDGYEQAMETIAPEQVVQKIKQVLLSNKPML